MKPILTPRELAEAIGVSESSVKRWVDDGSIAASKTAGGHRRIPIREAVRFIRETRAVLAKPEALGLSDVASVAAQFPEEGGETEALLSYLEAGATEEAKGLLLSLYLNGRTVSEIVDGPLRGSMARLGELWQHRPDGIFIEHRATDIVNQALVRLRTLIPRQAARPVAVGGAAPGDVYQLPSLSAATVLEAAGFEAVNLGADVPIESLDLAVDQLGADLVWISVSGSSVSRDVAPQIERFAGRLRERRVPLVVGGRRSADLGLRSGGNLRVGGSMAELEAVAQGMLFAGGTTDRPN